MLVVVESGQHVSAKGEMTVASKTKTLPENSPEEGGGFVYAAVEVFSM